MDRRSWPWKKKSSEKTMSAPDSAVASLASATSQGDQDNSMKVNYVQISVESYAHLTDLENQVKTLNDEVDMLNEKLSAAQSEITTKENHVKQHTKVAEDAVSGWEKADAEALALKNQLESVTLLKLTAEDRVSHLDGALKECMKQVRNLKEEHELKLQQTVLTKTKQWEKIKHELEAKMIDLDQEILRSSAENATLSRSLHERSDMLMKISEEKSQAEVEIELLRADIQSCEKEINSYKYELHIISKELEIRNEEKNMSVRSAEVANKQHLEGVKKIAKLESECQRLRGLVRKKLPGPAALAQMKIEVESLGRDYGETRIRRSPVKNSDSHLTPVPDFSLDNAQQCHKENEFLSARLLASEEETKMLKEALAKRNCELQASRTLCAKTTSKLRNFETQMQVLNQNRSPDKLNIEIPTKGYSSPNTSDPPSLTSISVDEVDEESRNGESWATALISELSHFNKEKSAGKTNKVDNSNHQEVMDDFLEMERLACSPTESHGAISIPDNSTDRRTENEDHNTLCDTSEKLISSNGDLSKAKHESDVNQVSLSKLRSRISMIFDSDTNDADMVKILEEIKHVLQDALPQSSPSYDLKERVDAAGNQQDILTDTGENVDSEISLTQDTNPTSDSKVNIEQELATAVSQIHDFVLSLAKEAMAIQNASPQGHAFRQRIEQFSDSVSKVLCSKMSALDLLLDLSHVLVKAGELSINLLGYNSCERETDSSDCIDKVTLLENKVAQDVPLIERFPSDCTHISRSTSGPEVLQEGSSCSDSELKAALCKCTMELEELKSEKNKTATDLAICTENLERTELQLQDTNLLLAELKSQLESSQKSNSLAETQLKCMVESYRTLETRAQELEAEVDLLRTKVENIDNELQKEQQNHQDALVRCKDLQEKIESHESCSVCSLSSAADVDVKFKQEREIAAATEKLAECQETIFLLGRQLKTFHPPADHAESPYSNKDQINDDFMEEGPRRSSFSPQGMNGIQDPNDTEMESIASSSNVFLAKEAGRESAADVFDSLASLSDSDAKLILRSPIRLKHSKDSPTKSSSSSSSNTTPEKHPRSFSRFFSSKSKNGHKASVQNYE